MAKPRASRWCLVLLVSIQLCLGLVYLDRVPRVLIDEAWDSALGWNLAHNGKLAHPFIEGFGGVDIYFIQNRVILPITSALIFKFTECTIFTSRLGSVLFATLAVCSLFVLTSRWFGNKQAFCICLATMINPWFFEISRRARPEIHYTAMAIVLLLLLASYFESGSRLTAFFSGITCGILVLTHPNGIIVSFCVGTCSLLWLRGKATPRLLLWGFIGLVIILLPYLIYLACALQHPDVSFAVQMQRSHWGKSLIIKELARWKNFFVFPRLLPLGIVMYISFFAAWTDWKRQVKLLASITVLYCIILPFTSVQSTPLYLAAIVPFSAALIVRFLWRIFTSLKPLQKTQKSIRLTAGIVLMLAYVLPCAYSVGMWLYRLHDADFNKVLDKVAAAVGPESLIYADPIFWYGARKYRYGPYPILYEGRELRDCINWCRSHRFDYAVRTSWRVCPPYRAERPLQKMPDYREGFLCDYLCQRFGTKVNEFYDPYYGPIEIYKLDWSRSYLLP